MLESKWNFRWSGDIKSWNIERRNVDKALEHAAVSICRQRAVLPQYKRTIMHNGDLPAYCGWRQLRTISEEESRKQQAFSKIRWIAKADIKQRKHWHGLAETSTNDFPRHRRRHLATFVNRKRTQFRHGRNTGQHRTQHDKRTKKVRYAFYHDYFSQQTDHHRRRNDGKGRIARQEYWGHVCGVRRFIESHRLV